MTKVQKAFLTRSTEKIRLLDELSYLEERELEESASQSRSSGVVTEQLRREWERVKGVLITNSGLVLSATGEISILCKDSDI